MSLLVFGHRNPDTDAICSAIAYADFLKRTTRPDAIAACCGTPNQRTEFALKKAGLQHPKIIMDIRPEIEDVCNPQSVVARFDDVFFDVYERMNENEIRAIPVLNDEEDIVGIVTLLDLLELMLQGGVDPIQSRCVQSTLAKVNSVIGGSFQHSVDPHRKDDFVVTVGAMSAGGFTDRMNEFPAEQLLVVSGDRPTIQLPALEMGVRGLVVTGGFQLSSGLMELAKNRNVAILNSPYDTATTTMRIKAAQAIESIIDTNFMTLPAKMPVETARQQVFRSTQTIFPVVDNGKLTGVLSLSLIHI